MTELRCAETECFVIGSIRFHCDGRYITKHTTHFDLWGYVLRGGSRKIKGRWLDWDGDNWSVVQWSRELKSKISL